MTSSNFDLAQRNNQTGVIPSTACSFLFLNVIFLMVLSTTGCSPTSAPNYAELGLVEVGGRVLLDNQPVPKVEVRLVTVEDGIYSYGVTDDNGNYSLMFDSRTRGIIPGKKQVVVVGSTAGEEGVQIDEEESEEPEGAAKKKGDSRVPKCYGRDSKYMIEVVGASSALDIELKTDCSNSR